MNERRRSPFGMGRPTRALVAAKHVRSQRYTDEELAAITKARGKVDESEYIRRAALAAARKPT